MKFLLLLTLQVIFSSKNINGYYIRVPSNIKNKLKEFLINYPKVYVEIGLSSYYHQKFHGKKTATGDVFSNLKWTCAHRTLPIPSVVLVIFSYGNEIRGLKLLVNDRGPFKAKRILDVSLGVAQVMDLEQKGLEKIILFFLPQETNKILVSRIFQPDYKLLNIEEIIKILLLNKIFIT